MTQYSCGAELPITSDPETQLYVRNQLTCDTEINAHYYTPKLLEKFNMGPILCAICAEEITDDEKLEQLKANQKRYSVAKPTCSDECGPFIFKREKKKRKQAGAQKTKSVKRQL